MAALAEDWFFDGLDMFVSFFLFVFSDLFFLLLIFYFVTAEED